MPHRKLSEKYPVPDWRNPQDYNFTQTLTGRGSFCTVTRATERSGSVSLLSGVPWRRHTANLVSGLSLEAGRLERLTSEAVALRDGDYRRLLLLD